MSHTPHELAEEFPEFVKVMQQMKAENAHFARLFDDYHEVNLSIYRAESKLEPTDDFNAAEMRKQRLNLKDEIWSLIKLG
jgi:uncharacterized protein